MPEQIVDRINELSDALVLRELHLRAVTIASLSDFSLEIERLTAAEDSSAEQLN